MFGNSNGSSNGSEDTSGSGSAVEGVLETVLLEHTPAPVDRRVAALEMAMTLVCNREEGSTGEDAVGVTRIADVLLEWLQQDSDSDTDAGA